MTLISVVIYLALIGLVLVRRFKGQAITTPKKHFVLPTAVAFIGLQDMAHAKVSPVDVSVIVFGSVLSLGLGALRGQMDKVDMREGLPWARWSTASLAVFAGTIASKLAVDVIGVAAGGTLRALSSSLVFTLGLTLLGEAAIVWVRSQALHARPVASNEGSQ